MAIDEEFIIRLKNDISNAVLAFFKEKDIDYTWTKKKCRIVVQLSQ